MAFSLTTTACAASPATTDQESLKQCELEAWSVDRDPKGLNVRAEPSPKAKILGTLPALVEGRDERDFGIPVRITGSQNGWLRIEGAKDDPSRSGLTARETYAGSGWVHGTMLRFAVQSGQGYEKPRTTSRSLIDLGDDWLTDFGTIHRIVACDGKWALLDFSIQKQRDKQSSALRDTTSADKSQRAWFRGICANQETTCDGVLP